MVCVVGWKDSGKTAVTVALVGALGARGWRVMTVKHGHGFDLDAPGTDSWRHRHEGGARRVVLAGPEEMAVMGQWGPDGEMELGEIVERFLPDADLVVAEGYKRTSMPKVEVFRAARHEAPLYRPDAPEADGFLAVVSDVALDLPGVACLPLDALDLGARLAELVERALLGGARPGGAAGRVSGEPSG